MAVAIVRAIAASAVALASLAIGFAVLDVHDVQSMATIRSALVITDADGAVPVVRILRAEAKDREANFYRLRVDPTGRFPTRTVSPIVGDRAAYDAAFPQGRYARFNTEMTTTSEPLDGSVIGGYLSTLSATELKPVAARLTAAGAEAQVETLGWDSLFRYLLGYTPTVTAGAVVIGVAWVAGVTWSLARARQVAVARTFGMPIPLARDVGVSVLIAAGAFVAFGAAAAPALVFHNGGHQLAAYFGVSGVVWGAFIAAFVAGASIPAVLPRCLQFRPAFSPWLPVVHGATATSVVQVLTLTLVVVLVAQAAAAWASLAAVRDSRPDWQACASCTTTIFQGFDGPAALDEAVAPYASAVRAAEPGGGVILSWARGAVSGDQYTPDDPGANVLVVNPAFLEHCRGQLGDPLRGVDGPGEWGLLIPQDRADRAEYIAREWQESFLHPFGSVPHRAAPKRPHIGFYPPQEVFNYGQTDFRDQVYSDSPVIVVLPASAGLLDDDSYFAAGSAGSVLFTDDVAALRERLDAAGVGRSTYVIDTLEDQMERSLIAARAKLPMALGGGVVGLIAVFGMLVVLTRASIWMDLDRLLLYRTLGRLPLRGHLRTALRTAVVLGCSGVLLVVVTWSGLVGADVDPALLWICSGALAAIVVMTHVVVVRHLTSTKELLHAR